MRLWHYKLLPYLPDLQFKGQLRELVAIKRDWAIKGTTNHLLINRVMEYPKDNLYWYFCQYEAEYHTRCGKKRSKLVRAKNKEQALDRFKEKYGINPLYAV